MESRTELDIIVNGKPLTSFGGSALLDYAIGAVEMDTDTFQGINRSNWLILQQRRYLRPVEITIIFRGKDLHDAKMQRSRFNGEITGKAELYIPDDGFYYDVYCTSMGAEEIVGQGDADAAIKSRYAFRGVRRGALISQIVEPGGTLYCQSTMPLTDCRLTAKATLGSTATLDGATFSGVSANDVLVFDGLDCAVTKNGTNCAATASWLKFPQLAPGENTIAATGTGAVTVEYYPVYL